MDMIGLLQRVEALEKRVRSREMVIDVLSLMVTPDEFYRAKDLLFESIEAEQRIEEYRRECANRFRTTSLGEHSQDAPKT